MLQHWPLAEVSEIPTGGWVAEEWTEIGRDDSWQGETGTGRIEPGRDWDWWRMLPLYHILPPGPKHPMLGADLSCFIGQAAALLRVWGHISLYSEETSSQWRS